MNIQMGMGWGAEREFDNAKGQLHTQQDGASDLEIGERVQCSHQERLAIDGANAAQHVSIEGAHIRVLVVLVRMGHKVVPRGVT